MPCAPNGEVFATYPSGNCGHFLYICVSCGHIYAVDIEEKVYWGPPLEELLSFKRCSVCDTLLLGSICFYPETFIDVEGLKRAWERPREIPPLEDSLILDFENLYKDVKR